MKPSVKDIVGEWVSDPQRDPRYQEYGQVTMEFMENGSLIYTIHKGDKQSIMLLTYRVEDDMLVTDQPSSPRIERTRFYFSSKDELVLVTEKGPWVCHRHKPSLLRSFLNARRKLR